MSRVQRYVVNQDFNNFKYIEYPDWDVEQLYIRLRNKHKKEEAAKAKE